MLSWSLTSSKVEFFDDFLVKQRNSEPKAKVETPKGEGGCVLFCF